MGIKDEANNLDAALKRGTTSARQLNLAIAQSGNNLLIAGHAAADMTQSILSATKATAALAGPVGLLLEGATMLGAGFLKVKMAQQDVTNEVRAITAATKALNAEARNDPRLAQTIRIREEQAKSLADIAKKASFLGGGITAVFTTYAGQIAAVNAQAQAAINNLDASINRSFKRMREDAALETQQQSPGLAFLSPEAQQLRLNELARQAARLRVERQAQDTGLNANQTKQLVDSINEQFNNAAELIRNTTIKSLGDSLGRSFADSIAGGISAGIESGSIEKGFKNLTGGMLIGLGRMMIEIGTQSLLAANLFSSIIQAFREFAPAGAIGPALGLIAAGAIAEGLGSSMMSSGGGGGGRGGFSGGGSSGGATIIDRGLINPANGFVTSPGVITPTAGAPNYIFLIGKDDPRAQRDLLEMVDRGRMRRGDR
jgi:hypothetical protein